MLNARTLRAALLLGLALCAAPGRAGANFHLWDLVEVYSNADGSIQYIELSTSSTGQGVLDLHTLTSNSDGVQRTFTFHGNLATETEDQRMLLATPGFAALPGAVTPDYVLPCGPFFDPSATLVTLNFSGVDTLVFSSAQLPTNGTLALVDASPGGAPSLSTAANTPTNVLGNAGQLTLTECQSAGTCEPCDDGLFCNGAESCANSACSAASPCGSLCDEETNACVECLSATDCSDAEICTAESCESGSCVYTPVPGNCDDGQFCTTFDMCAGGTCSGGVMSPCAGENCNEDGDFCGECAQAGDCEDGNPCTINSCDGGRCFIGEANDGTSCADNGIFCDGPEACSVGSCQSAGIACNAETQTCNEDDEICVPIPEPGASGGLAALLALAAIAASRDQSSILAHALR